MVYPTPGFVVRQTFLEFNEQAEQKGLRRVASDSALPNLYKQRDSLYGSEDLRDYVEQTLGQTPPQLHEQSRQVQAEGLFTFAAALQEIVANVKKAADENTKDEVNRNSTSCSSFSSKVSESDCDPSFTTLFFQNIPQECSRPVLCQVLDSEGFSGCYDFAYVPVDLVTMLGNGYGFVNFTCHDEAMRALRAFHGFTRWPVTCTDGEICHVTWSSFRQGLEAHIERYRNSPVMHEKVADICKPILLRNGTKIPFPAPTKRLRVPRVRGKTSQRGRGGKAYADGAGDGDSA